MTFDESTLSDPDFLRDYIEGYGFESVISTPLNEWKVLCTLSGAEGKF